LIIEKRRDDVVLCNAIFNQCVMKKWKFYQTDILLKQAEGMKREFPQRK